MITKDMSIAEILRLEPGAAEVFATFGMNCSGCMGSASETLENAARAHDVDCVALLTELNRLS